MKEGFAMRFLNITYGSVQEEERQASGSEGHPEAADGRPRPSFSEGFCKPLLCEEFNKEIAFADLGRSSDRQSAAVICRDNYDNGAVLAYFEQAAQVWGVDVACPEIEELTLDDFRNLRAMGMRGNLIEKMLEKYNLVSLARYTSFRGAYNSFFFESMVPDDCCRLSKAKALARAGQAVMSKALKEEVGRIYQLSSTSRRVLHPVHYIIESNNRSEARIAIDTLAMSMLSRDLLTTKSIRFLDLDSVGYRYDQRFPNRFDDLHVETISELAKGGILVVYYGAYDQDSRFDQDRYGAFVKLTKALDKNKFDTVVFYVLPENNPGLIDRFTGHYGMPCATISRDTKRYKRGLTRVQAQAILKKRLRAFGLKLDKSFQPIFDEHFIQGSLPEVDTIFDEYVLAQSLRTDYPGYQELVGEIRQCGKVALSARERLDALIGLDNAKKLLERLVKGNSLGREYEKRGLKKTMMSGHMVFTGNPGTGKTEVARLYGEILKEQGFLSEGRVIECSGGKVGERGDGVRETFEKARGSILFLDEAYAISPQCIAELIAEMENHREDTVVILSGYQKQMEGWLNLNPGFKSRIGYFLDFPDYSPKQLLEIFKKMAKDEEKIILHDTLLKVQDVFERSGRKADFGNARFVRSVFEQAITKQNERLADISSEKLTKRDLQVILPEDTDYEIEGDKEELPGAEQLAGLIGLKDTKKLVEQFVSLFKMQKAKRERGLTTEFMPMHMAFRGNPGTGKTGVARIMGKILADEKVLRGGEFIEVSRTDLIAPFVGQTAPKVRALFERARGSVLFIDEAYSIFSGQRDEFGAEALAEMMIQLENLREEVVVIFAGYTDEMDKLFAANPGFKSRVMHQINFPDYSVPELVKIFRFMTKQRGLTVDAAVIERVRGILEQAAGNEDFGNARYVRQLIDQALLRQAERLASSLTEKTNSKDLLRLTDDDFAIPKAGSKTKHAVGFLA